MPLRNAQRASDDLSTAIYVRRLLLRALIELAVALGVVEAHVVFATLRLQCFAFEGGGDDFALRDGEAIMEQAATPASSHACSVAAAMYFVHVFLPSHFL
jgi:hypothetical protein